MHVLYNFSLVGMVILDCIRFIHNLKLKFYSLLCCSPNNI